MDLAVEEGRFVSLVGPSGSGKSSLLRAVIGLQQPLSGTVETGLPPGQIGILFQDDALLPWKTARENVALGLVFAGMQRNRALAEAEAWLDRLGLAGFGDRFPRHLSGGQRKRVALAQVLAMRPRLILMDEPFASLDAIVRARIVRDVVALVERERISVLLSRTISKRRCASPTRSTCCRAVRAPGLRSITRCRSRDRAIPSIRALIPPSRRSMNGCGLICRARSITGRRRSVPLNAPYAWLRRLVAFAVLLALWELAGQAGMLNPIYAPMPSRVGAVLAELFVDGRIWPHLQATFTAALGGLAIGIAVGIVLGSSPNCSSR